MNSYQLCQGKIHLVIIILNCVYITNRDRHDALEQRFSSLQISGNMWKDIGNMRKGVEIESTTMAHNKLMMNYDWYINYTIFINHYFITLLLGYLSSKLFFLNLFLTTDIV